MAKKRKSKRQRQVSATQSLEHTRKYQDGGPASFVVKIGDVPSPLLAELVLNFRTIFSPRTAMNLIERKSAKIKDYKAVCSQLGITHCLFFSQTLLNSVVRMCHFPQGPTLYFNIESYSLMKDLARSSTHPVSLGNAIQTSPIAIIEGFDDSDGMPPHLVLCKTFLKNLLPKNPTTHAKLSQSRRVVLFYYDSISDQVIIRHYKIQVKDQGSLSDTIANADKNITAIVTAGKSLDDYVLENLAPSKEDEELSTELKVSKKKRVTRKLQLVEVGPRVSLTLFQVQEGFCEGKNLYLRDNRKEEINQDIPINENSISEERRVTDSDSTKNRA